MKFPRSIFLYAIYFAVLILCTLYTVPNFIQLFLMFRGCLRTRRLKVFYIPINELLLGFMRASIIRVPYHIKNCIILYNTQIPVITAITIIHISKYLSTALNILFNIIFLLINSFCHIISYLFY